MTFTSPPDLGGLQSNGCSSEEPQREPRLGDMKCIVHLSSHNNEEQLDRN